MTLYLHMRERNVTSLGPGKRFGVWVAGCHRRCPGCVAPESHDMTRGDAVDVGALAWEILTSGAEGITISGGEPFLQAEALAQLLQIIHSKRDMGVIVYTGYLLEELSDVPDAQLLLAQTDLLVDGPYVRELDDGRSLCGIQEDGGPAGSAGKEHDLFSASDLRFLPWDAVRIERIPDK